MQSHRSPAHRNPWPRLPDREGRVMHTMMTRAEALYLPLQRATPPTKACDTTKGAPT
ncbi:hypothetical protein [Pseudooceanicola nanhaiensis]|uniref:hypothetical protein n=1 Tax=Pseudooceanicola nanhaiensis TaxID=375761 RepID=UPI001CD4FF64|nr:hypothetical protein [Pseudooceanicola nanhaiensis]MCA0921692.1 hypothetical protein [Pseudooceanicola nanhaiensis]